MNTSLEQISENDYVTPDHIEILLGVSHQITPYFKRFPFPICLPNSSSFWIYHSWAASGKLDTSDLFDCISLICWAFFSTWDFFRIQLSSYQMESIS